MKTRLIALLSAGALAVSLVGAAVALDRERTTSAERAAAGPVEVTPAVAPIIPPKAEGMRMTATPASSVASFGFSQGYQPLTLSDPALETLFAGIHSTGAGTVRLDLPWQEVQAEGPAHYDFSNVLRVYTAAENQGLTVLPVTSGMPDWAGASFPRSPESYYNFLYQAGKVLIPLGINAVEVWNEVNLDGISPATYTNQILAPGARGFRAAGQELDVPVTIVSSGLAVARTGWGSYSQHDFLAGVYAAGGRDYFDAVGAHPYTWPNDPADNAPNNSLRRTSDLYAMMVANGDGAKQIWATEFGFPTNTGSGGISQARQSDYLARGAALWASFPWAGPLIFYSYRDLPGRASDPENRFGLISSDGVPKPALDAVESLIRSGAKQAVAGRTTR